MSTLKRGTKHKVLPEDLIVKLAAEGMSPKAIAERLYADGGILVAGRTIKRMLLTLASVGKTEGGLTVADKHSEQSRVVCLMSKLQTA